MEKQLSSSGVWCSGGQAVWHGSGTLLGATAPRPRRPSRSFHYLPGPFPDFPCFCPSGAAGCPRCRKLPQPFRPAVTARRRGRIRGAGGFNLLPFFFFFFFWCRSLRTDSHIRGSDLRLNEALSLITSHLLGSNDHHCDTQHSNDNSKKSNNNG